MSSMSCSLCVQLKEEAEWKEKLEVERARTMNLVQPKTNYKEKYEHLIGKEAALDAARYQFYLYNVVDPDQNCIRFQHRCGSGPEAKLVISAKMNYLFLL